MEVPPEFKYMATCFYWDGLREAKSEDEWISSRLKILNSNQKEVVRKFLKELLQKNPDGAELRRVWSSGHSGVLFPEDEHLRLFLSIIRDKLTPH